MSNSLAEKAKKCFERLHRVLKYKKISLKRTFEAYDKEGYGNLSFESFKNMISRLDPSFNDEDIHIIFDVIDTDHSKTIEFEELFTYFCKVNGLPSTYDDGETPLIRNKMQIWFWYFYEYWNVENDHFMLRSNKIVVFFSLHSKNITKS